MISFIWKKINTDSFADIFAFSRRKMNGTKKQKSDKKNSADIMNTMPTTKNFKQNIDKKDFNAFHTTISSAASVTAAKRKCDACT